jgi:hypothetical protein
MSNGWKLGEPATDFKRSSLRIERNSKMNLTGTILTISTIYCPKQMGIGLCGASQCWLPRSCSG